MDETPLAAEPHFKKTIEEKGKRHVVGGAKNGERRFVTTDNYTTTI